MKGVFIFTVVQFIFKTLDIKILHVGCSRSSVPGNVPLPLHQQVNLLNTSVVGVVQSLRQMLLHEWLKVLVGLLTLKQRNNHWYFDL